MARVETFRACRNLVSPHPQDAYPGIALSYRPPGWKMIYIGPAVGVPFDALGGESTSSYTLPASGLKADGFTLAAGDRATVLAWLDAKDGFLAEWRIERA